MRTKLLWTLSLFVVLGINVLPVQSQTFFLDIKKWDSVDQKIQLNALNRITFSNTDLILNYLAGTNDNIATSSIQSIIFGTNTGIKNIQVDKNTLSIYPNPSNDFIFLKNGLETNVNISIYSVSGYQIMSLQNYSVNDPINISQLNKGIYIIKINNKALKLSKL